MRVTFEGIMKKNVGFVVVCCLFWFCVGKSAPGSFRVGVGKVDVTPDVGVPLAGYNWGDRRVSDWPLFKPTKYTTWMTPSVGAISPLWARALVVDNGQERVAFVTVDAIGMDGSLRQLAYNFAQAQGLTIPSGKIIFSGSHTHSGPGAVSPEFLWEFAPATDLLVPEVQQKMAQQIASALVQAEKSLQPGVVGIGMGNLTGVTTNRRADISPYVKPNSIDSHLGIIRVDDLKGNPLATVWNFAIHGTCFGPSNMMFSGDIMGYANELIESTVGGISLFINGDAGDIAPGPGMCDNKPQFKGSSIIAAAVKQTRSSVTPVSSGAIKALAKVIDFGPTNLNFTLQRFFNCTHGGPLDICTICRILKCDINAHFYSSIVETTPLFTGFAFNVNGKNIVMASIPGEALFELGNQIREDAANAGFNITFLCGYSQNHMGYFATPDEYDVGGYESQLTFWGIGTSDLVRNGCKSVITALSSV